MNPKNVPHHRRSLTKVQPGKPNPSRDRSSLAVPRVERSPGSRHASRRAAALLAVAGAWTGLVGLPATPAFAQDWHWNAAHGNWSSFASWAPFLAPPAPGSNVFIGSMPSASNSIVVNDLGGTQTLSNFVITDGMTAHNTITSRYVVAGTTSVSGSNTIPGPFPVQIASRLWLNFVDGLTLTTNNLVLSDGGVADFNSAFARINNQVNIGTGSRIHGVGVVDFWNNGTTLINNGTISSSGANEMRFRQFGGGVYDLDGTTGNGVIDLASVPGSVARFQGTALSDSFSGHIALASGSQLRMELADGWTADAGSTIDVHANSLALGEAEIRGGSLDFGGQLNIHGSGGWFDFRNAHLTLQPTVQARIASNTSMSTGLATPATVLGGTYDLEPSATVRFYSPADMRGGSFNRVPHADGSTGGYGTVDWFAPSQWNGNVTVDGIGRVFEPATVYGPTVINGQNFHLSASPFSPTTWNVNNSLVVNADQIGPLADGFGHRRFDGTMNIAGGFLGRFTLNLSGPNPSWELSGSMNLTGDAILFPTRLAGSAMSVTGNVTLASGRAQITADTSFAPGSTLTFGANDAILRTRGLTRFAQGTELIGNGTVRNGLGGELVLDHAVDFQKVGLINDGLFSVGDGPAIASVDRFRQTDSGTWSVDVFGSLAGFEHDILVVSDGAAELAGTLEVSVLGTTSAAYLPALGDEFTILVAPAGVSGSFDNQPVSFYYGGAWLEWSVVYNPHSVVIRLDNIIPSPGAAALLGLGLLTAARRRRA